MSTLRSIFIACTVHVLWLSNLAPLARTDTCDYDPDALTSSKGSDCSGLSITCNKGTAGCCQEYDGSSDYEKRCAFCPVRRRKKSSHTLYNEPPAFFIYCTTQKGQFQDSDNYNEDSCTNCPKGEYQDETGKSSCKDCPSGNSNGMEGARNTAECDRSSCPTGKYGLEPPCQDCPQGKYLDEAGQTEQSDCKACPSK